ncbi:MAG: hypothetical protein F6K47_42740 [Symploca sp. SIO2E6]|nr:hypothetical protein [Symploca sp. SIO2E6]
MKTLLPPASEPPASCLKKAYYLLLILPRPIIRLILKVIDRAGFVLQLPLMSLSYP